MRSDCISCEKCGETIKLDYIGNFQVPSYMIGTYHSSYLCRNCTEHIIDESKKASHLSYVLGCAIIVFLCTVILAALKLFGVISFWVFVAIPEITGLSIFLIFACARNFISIITMPGRKAWIRRKSVPIITKLNQEKTNDKK